MVPFQVLKEFGLFDGLDDGELAKLAELCQERNFEEGDICFRQNASANELHLCRFGKINIVVNLYEPWSREVTIYRAKAGEVFGWSALVEPCLYTSSAKCAERTQELYLKGSDLKKLFEENPRIGYVVMTNLSATISSRLSETRQKLSREYAAATQHDYEW
ncbi:MAG: cyclic nucleotide-binding domain-containing protein [Dehalococcoidia bacterium]